MLCGFVFGVRKENLLLAVLTVISQHDRHQMKFCVGVLGKISQAVLRFFNIGLFFVPNRNRIKVRHEDLSLL